MDNLNKISVRIERLSKQDLSVEGAPFLLRIFTFIVKEFPDLFYSSKKENHNSFVVKKQGRKIIYDFYGVPFSCGRYIIDDKSKLYVGSVNGRHRLFNFSDLNFLLALIMKPKGSSRKVSLKVKTEIDKIIQQTKYFIFISHCANAAKKIVFDYLSGEELFEKLFFVRKKRILSFLILDSFGVMRGHIDHPTPYPYLNNLNENMLGVDPFLSCCLMLRNVICLRDNELFGLSKKLLSSSVDKKNALVNGIYLMLVPKYYFSQKDYLILEHISLMLHETARVFGGHRINYDSQEFFLLFLPKIESELIKKEDSGLSLPHGCVALSDYLPGFSTSSGRSIILPIVLQKQEDFLYLKTSWPNVIKTSLNRGLSPSKIQWFKICGSIYNSLHSKYYTFLFERHFYPAKNIKDDNAFKYLTFIKRDFILRDVKKKEFIVPLIGLVLPNHPYPISLNPFLHLMKSSKHPNIFLKSVISSIASVIIFQLLNKGVFHGLHLQNCCLLFSKDNSGVLSKKVIIRDGDIRICRNYLSLLSSEEKSMIDKLKKKRGKINSKNKFFKYLFHNIINENFGNIEQCLLVDKDFSSGEYWQLVHSCFEDAISKESSEIKRNREYRKIHDEIIRDFKRAIYMGSGYSANFFHMEFLGAKEDFVKVDNPFKKYVFNK